MAHYLIRNEKTPFAQH